MPTETTAAPAVPSVPGTPPEWERVCRDLAALLRDSGSGPVEVTALGFRDGLAQGPSSGPSSSHSPVPRVQLYGHHALVGPLPRAGGEGDAARPCPRCLARRWQSVRGRALRDALELGSGTRAAGVPPYALPFLADTIAALLTAHREREAGRAREASTTAGDEAAAGTGGTRDTGTAGADGPFPAVHLVDLETLRVSRHPLVPDAECPDCGRGVPDDARTATLTLRPAPEHRPGSFRVRGIGAYDLPTEAFANPLCGALGPGVVHDVASATTSATVGCFELRSGEYLRETFWGGHADSYADSARIGVLEGLERAAGMRARGRRTRVRASLAALRARGEAAVDPRECGLYPPEFHRAEPRVTPFTPDREIPWVWGYSLRDHRPLLVPEILTYYGTPGLENRFVQESSNGCASGGSLEEAVYFGLMEVVERDAFLLAWYGRPALPEIDPRTSADPRTRQMVDRLAMYGYEARFFDTRITFPVPVVTAVAVRADGGPGTMCFGAGAGLDPEAALAGGLCEIATDAVNIRGRAERDGERLRAMAADFDKVLALHDHPLVYGLPEMSGHAGFLLAARGPKRSMAELYGPGTRVLPASGDLRDDVERCVATVADAGFDVVVVDQTLPEQRDLGLHTVSVLVPGLLPIDFGWRRQRAPHMPRMRTALREAGLRDRDLRPGDLNPAPHPFP
ncbi:ribosomal protein S12 methylthiotransferase accessory factor [Streptomyces eurocidicus]|uniref:Ribosomal protein S12 methylthiotransferase accessory factor n=1 Tax=Streptomyces eurocidicus TaxID=66423 RepID=A0A7W8BFC9_STREU|nr:TOMM precursor leader peptide-binding protein [Streptomyces eurocidicus]MBB5121887.1 ribosomal protein S12 methylthiotransferase accessory factor [Streptomyces eurocidicus]